MQKSTTILDSTDGRILLLVDGCTLRAILEAVSAKGFEPRLDDFRNAVQSYHKYKNAQATVAAYEQPARAQAIKDTFVGRKVK